MKRLLAALILILLTAPVNAQDFDKGYLAWVSKDYATALAELRPLAEQGHAKAQNVLAHMYEQGTGIPQSHAEAVKWYRKSAVQHYDDAQFNLAYMYWFGRGVPKNYVLAYIWWHLAGSIFERDSYAAEKLSGSQIAEAQRMAREWLEAHPQ